VDQLADLVADYLKTEYKPHEIDSGEVGYHVAGFNPQGEPRLHHIFWGFDLPRRANQKVREYRKQVLSPPEGEVQYLYNGRNDLVDPLMHHFLDKIINDPSFRIDIKTTEGLIKLADLVIRFSAEITNEVAPPFHFFLMSPGNIIRHKINGSRCPLTENEIDELMS
jgi:hypothetical protein